MDLLLAAILFCLVLLILLPNRGAMALLDCSLGALGAIVRTLILGIVGIGGMVLIYWTVAAGIRDPKENGGILAMLTLFAVASIIWLVRGRRSRRPKKQANR